MKRNTITAVISPFRYIIIMLAVVFATFIISLAFTKTAQAENLSIAIDTPDVFGQSSVVIAGDTGSIVITDPWASQMTSAGFLLVYEYSSSAPDVVQIDTSGNYTALSQGTANIDVKIYKETSSIIYESEEARQFDIAQNTRTYHYTLCVGANTSAAVPDTTSVTGYSLGKPVYVHLTNIPALQYYTFYYDCEDGMWINCSYDNTTNTISFSSYSAAKGNVKVTINNTVFNIYVLIKEVNINKDNLLLTTKTKKTLKIRNYSKSKVTWKSADPKIAKVNSNGVLTTKKLGNTIIYATLDSGEMFGCAVCVVTPKMKKVVDRAVYIGKNWKYSQPLRMRTGYYDCSSLVWQCYKLAGKNFGARYYAPVAADILHWCVTHKKTLKKSVRKKIYKLSLRPGDITFRTGQNNGRYKGTYHVEMFVGYRCVHQYDGTVTISTMWAARGNDYPPDEKYIARP